MYKYLWILVLLQNIYYKKIANKGQCELLYQDSVPDFVR